MRRFIIVLAFVAAACSGGDADTTVIVDATTTAPPATTTTIPATSTTTSTSTSTSTSTTSTTTTTLPAGFTTYTHELFTFSYPGTWSENPESGVGFVEDHIALALPSTTFEIYLELQEAGFDLDDHVQRLQDDLALFVPDFRVLRSGDQLIDGVRSLWFEYSEEIDGFPVVVREQTALRGDLLTTFTLISPVEFFEFDQGQAVAVIESFRFA